jgi:hypothetical protein
MAKTQGLAHLLEEQACCKSKTEPELKPNFELKFSSA